MVFIYFLSIHITLPAFGFILNPQISTINYITRINSVETEYPALVLKEISCTPQTGLVCLCGLSTDRSIPGLVSREISINHTESTPLNLQSLQHTYTQTVKPIIPLHNEKNSSLATTQGTVKTICGTTRNSGLELNEWMKIGEYCRTLHLSKHGCLMFYFHIAMPSFYSEIDFVYDSRRKWIIAESSTIIKVDIFQISSLHVFCSWVSDGSELDYRELGKERFHQQLAQCETKFWFGPVSLITRGT